MRILVVGSNCAKLAVHLMKEQPGVEWHTITSFSNSLELYAPFHPVLCKDFKEVDVPDKESIGLCLDVIAKSFVDRPWTNAKLTSTKHLIVVTSTPTTLLPKSILDTFERIYIGKTDKVDKQSLHYSLLTRFEPNKTFVEFKNIVKNLDPSTFVHIKTGDKNLLYFKLEDGMETKETKKEAKETKENTDSIVSSTQNIEIELDLVVDSATQPQDVLTNLQSMIQNDLITSMIHSFKITKDDTKHRVKCIVHVLRFRQDLFASLSLNMLLSLRDAGMILRGSILV